MVYLIFTSYMHIHLIIYFHLRSRIDSIGLYFVYLKTFNSSLRNRNFSARITNFVDSFMIYLKCLIFKYNFHQRVPNQARNVVSLLKINPYLHFHCMAYRES